MTRLGMAILNISECEQQRIGKDLHDGVCQELAGIAYLMRTLDQKLQKGARLPDDALANISELIQQALKHGRALARGLRPVDHLPGGLAFALRQLASDTIDMTGARCRFDEKDSIEIHDPTIATNLYRIAQECVRNARQFGASKIKIELSRSNGMLRLAVSDNGVRPTKELFDDELVREMILHRTCVMGGFVSMRRPRGGGAVITCEIPYANGASNDHEQSKKSRAA